MLKTFKIWIPLAIGVLGLVGLVNLTVQQNLRLNADDPQLQLAEDGAVRLANGSAAQSIIGPNIVDAGRSLAPFTIVFSADGKLIASSGQLDGRTPVPPTGTLDYAKVHGQERFTWQPTAEIRLATVLSYYSQNGHEGYILAARSLREVENREHRLDLICLAALISIWVTTFLAIRLIARQ